jgi:tRNA 2-thiouridine synthesizing protein A
MRLEGTKKWLPRSPEGFEDLVEPCARRITESGRRMNDGNAASADATWDAGDLGCGELVIELRRRINSLQPRQTLHLIALDPGAREDIPAWCRLTGHTLKRVDHPHYLIERKET